MEAANLPAFLPFGNAKKLDICVTFAKKITGAHETGGVEQNWGPVPLRPKTATGLGKVLAKIKICVIIILKDKVTVYNYNQAQ